MIYFQVQVQVLSYLLEGAKDGQFDHHELWPLKYKGK